jgi:putative flippase GtrA
MSEPVRSGARQATSAQLLRFVAAGGIAAGANYGSRFLFSAWFSFPVAIVLAYLVGMATAFVLMRQHVFEGGGKPVGRQVLWFTAVNGLAVLQTLIISLLLARWLLPAMGVESHVEAIAHLVGVVVPVGTSYLGHRYATFR